MSNWHSNDPIMNTSTPVSLDDLVNHLTKNGSQDVRRFDVRITSGGQVFTRGVPGHARAERDGTLTFSDDRPIGGSAEVHCGAVSDYYRNYFGCIVR